MNFTNYIIETLDIETDLMKKFKTTFGNDTFVIKGVKVKFSYHAMQRYMERDGNDSKIQLLDCLKKVVSAIHELPDDTYHVKIKSLNKGFIIKKNNRIMNVITVYGDEMINHRKTTVDVIIESWMNNLTVVTIG